MDNIVRNIYAGVGLSDALSLLPGQQLPAARLAINVSGDTSLLGPLYAQLIPLRNQQFFFFFQAESFHSLKADTIGRFFFLPNYYYRKDAPQLAYTGEISAAAQTALARWCENQGMVAPVFFQVEDFNETTSNENAFTYVTDTSYDIFFSHLQEQLVNFEWLSKQIILNVSSEDGVTRIVELFQRLRTELAEKHRGIYTALETINRLEEALRKSEIIIRFQEIEINNQKLYNQLIRGGAPVAAVQPKSNPTEEELPRAYAKLRADYSRLLADIGRMHEDIAWYKRTYEDRSLMGAIKEKVLQKFKGKAGIK